MRVKEYLHFRGLRKGLRGRELRQREGDVMDACGLTSSKRKIISTLSKGFRQRVALADALISRPPLLILDEPSNGLDPLQMRHVRELLAELRPKQTILLSTHLLAEVEQSCDRVLLLHRGRLCADDSPRNLVRKLRAVTDVKLELQGQGPFEEELGKISGVRKVMARTSDGDWKRYILRVEARADIRAAIFELALQRHWHIRELHRELPSLEDVFVELTEGE
jgi:ABC-2 type transport system ATP-binding protein